MEENFGRSEEKIKKKINRDEILQDLKSRSSWLETK